uniref:Uncharacterized protein n=1 Tax=Arundo donax TaxID=35708 RepID=A0A0A9FE32_ARUDO
MGMGRCHPLRMGVWRGMD